VANLTAAQTRNSNAQFNVSAAQNLFNLASGGQSNLQNQNQASTNNLTSELAGLRTTTGSSTTTTNPFLNSFYQSAGNTAGQALNAGIGSSTGGGGGGAGGGTGSGCTGGAGDSGAVIVYY